MCYTYILISLTTEKLYIGHTENLERRLEEHNSDKKLTYTSKKGPWKMIFKKEFTSRSEAVNFENYLKKLKNRKYVLDNYCDINR